MYLLRELVKIGANWFPAAKLGRFVTSNNVLQSCSNKEILLLQTQFLAFKELEENTQIIIISFSFEYKWKQQQSQQNGETKINQLGKDACKTSKTNY